MEIAEILRDQFPDEVLEVYDFHEQTGVIVQRERILDLLKWLFDQPQLQFKHIMALCGVDNSKRSGENPNLERFEVVYNLYSVSHGHSLRLRAQIPENDPCIDSVTPIWRGADWLERETYDLVGISFNDHPDLRRVLLPEDWQGHPLQKDCPLRGKKEWIGMEDLLARVEKLKKYDFNDSAPGNSTS
jgi:NADH-quinone oxidoreductase subunit C